MSAQQQTAAPPNPVQIFNTLQGYQRAFALKAAVDLDLFTVIAKGSRTAAEIAKNCGAAERGVAQRCAARLGGDAHGDEDVPRLQAGARPGLVPRGVARLAALDRHGDGDRHHRAATAAGRKFS